MRFLKNKKGFTLIELLVVIAIIGILASVVLVSLNAARNRANDAKAKANIAGLRGAMELHYDIGTTYVGGCASASARAYIAGTAVPAGMAAVCNEIATAYAAAMGPLSTGGYWCVDNLGASKNIGAALGAATVCP